MQGAGGPIRHALIALLASNCALVPWISLRLGQRLASEVPASGAGGGGGGDPLPGRCEAAADEPPVPVACPAAPPCVCVPPEVDIEPREPLWLTAVVGLAAQLLGALVVACCQWFTRRRADPPPAALVGVPAVDPRTPRRGVLKHADGR